MTKKTRTKKTRTKKTRTKSNISRRAVTASSSSLRSRDSGEAKTTEGISAISIVRRQAPSMVCNNLQARCGAELKFGVTAFFVRQTIIIHEKAEQKTKEPNIRCFMHTSGKRKSSV